MIVGGWYCVLCSLLVFRKTFLSLLYSGNVFHIIFIASKSVSDSASALVLASAAVVFLVVAAVVAAVKGRYCSKVRQNKSQQKKKKKKNELKNLKTPD